MSRLRISNVPQTLRKALLYYDRGIMLVNKPQGMVCQLSHKVTDKDKSSFNQLLEGIRKELGMSELPYPVHRLDKDTSGALLLARTKTWARKIQQQFMDDTITKTYLALVHGGPEKFPEKQGVIETCLSDDDGRVFLDPSGTNTITKWEVVASSPRAPITLLKLGLVTGHKHQLRIHLAKCLRTPIIGDSIFARTESTQQITNKITLPKDLMFLHSSELSLLRFNKNGPHKRFTQGFRVPVPSKFQVVCRDAGLSFDTNILKGEMFINGEPWQTPDHLLDPTDTCWVSDYLTSREQTKHDLDSETNEYR